MLYLVENFLYPFWGCGRKKYAKSVKTYMFFLYLYSDILMEISVISC